MARKIQHKRGLKKDLPVLDVAEFGFTTDTKELFVGSENGNVRIASGDELKNGIDTLATDLNLTQNEISSLVENVGDVSTLPTTNKKIVSSIVEVNGKIGGLSESVNAKLLEKANKLDVFLKTNGINVNDFDESTRKTFLEAQGINVNYVLGDGNVKPNNTNFLSSKNLFDKSLATLNYMVSAVTGNLSANTGHDSSDFIRIKPNTTYVKNVKGHVAFYNEGKGFISGINENTAYENIPFTTPSNASWVRFSINKTSGNVDITQLELGSVPTSYETFGTASLNTNIINMNSISQQTVLNISSPNKNLFNKTKAILNYLVSASTGNQSSNTGHDASEFIGIKPNTNYVKNVKGHVAFYDSSKVFISGISENTAQAGVSVTSPSNAAFIRFSINKGEGFSIENTQLEEGTVSTPYTPFGSSELNNQMLTVNKQLYSDDYSAYIKSLIFGNKHKGKILNTLGDSNTEKNKWQPTVKNTLGLSLVRNYGIGGTQLAGTSVNSMVNRYTTMDDNADIITVMGGGNDHGVNIPIGDNVTKDISTFKGALRVLCEGLLAKYPSKRIVFITPTPRAGNINSAGVHLREYAEAMKYICYEYSIPVIDGFGKLGWTISTANLFTDDGVHMNATGGERLARIVSSELNLL